MGCWRALHEAGVEFHAVAGASVGALNAALYVQGPWQEGWALWEGLRRKDVYRISKRKLARVLGSLAVVLIPNFSRKRRVLKRGPRLRRVVSAARNAAGVDLAGTLLVEGFLSAQPLERLMDRLIRPEAIRSSPVKLYVGVERHASLPELLAAFGGRGHVRHFLSHDLDAAALREVLLASAAIPGIFPQRRFHGALWGDPGHTEKAPLAALLSEDVDRILVVHLTEPGRATRETVAGKEVLHLRPAVDLGHFLAFGPDKARHLLWQGYRETQTLLGTGPAANEVA